MGIRLLATVLFWLSIIAQVSGQSLIPPIDMHLVTAKFSGFERNTFDSQAKDEIDWSNFRINTALSLNSDKRWSMFSQIEFKNVEKNGNYLRLAYIQYDINTNWLIRVGRNYNAAPYYTAPFCFALETVKFPREPWGCYGYGVQTEGRFGDGWELIADITGASNRRFQDTENFEKLETSWRVGKQIGRINIGQVTQISEDAIRTGMNFKFTPTKKLIFTGEYYHEESRSPLKPLDGAYILSNWYPIQYVGLHFQVDEQIRSGEMSTILTPGFLLRTKKDNVRLIFDYQRDIEERSDAFLGVIQVRF